MSIGIGIFLIMLGAILTFAVDWSIGGLDLQAVGWILMVAGVGGLILFFYQWNRRRVPQAVTVMRQRQATKVPRTYDDPTPVPAVPTVTPPPPLPETVMPQPLPPAQVTTVTATAPVAASSLGRPESAER